MFSTRYVSCLNIFSLKRLGLSSGLSLSLLERTRLPVSTLMLVNCLKSKKVSKTRCAVLMSGGQRQDCSCLQDSFVGHGNIEIVLADGGFKAERTVRTFETLASIILVGEVTNQRSD